jgi:hypothetical protein
VADALVAEAKVESMEMAAREAVELVVGGSRIDTGLCYIHQRASLIGFATNRGQAPIPGLSGIWIHRSQRTSHRVYCKSQNATSSMTDQSTSRKTRHRRLCIRFESNDRFARRTHHPCACSGIGNCLRSQTHSTTLEGSSGVHRCGSRAPSRLRGQCQGN